MQSKESVIVLGGVPNHDVLMDKLRARGYYVILADYLDEPVAAGHADEHVQISTFDEPAIRKLALERNAICILNSNLEYVNVGLSKIAEELGLPHLYDYETAVNVSNKRRMKSIMKENNIPTTDFICASSSKDLDNLSLRFPVFVKPSDGSGSTGVKEAFTYDEAVKYLDEAVSFSKNGLAIVEEAAIGKECSIYCFVVDGTAHVLLITEKFLEKENKDDLNIKCYATISPAFISELAEDKVRETAQKIADAFCLRTTPLFIQAMIDKEELNVIEFACRLSGGGGVQEVLLGTGIDLFELTIDAYLGNKIDLKENRKKLYTSTNIIYADDCVFDRVEGVEALINNQTVNYISVLRKSGSIINKLKPNTERIVLYVTSDETVQGILKKVHTAMETLEVYDTMGRKVMSRRLYLTDKNFEFFD